MARFVFDREITHDVTPDSVGRNLDDRRSSCPPFHFFFETNYNRATISYEGRRIKRERKKTRRIAKKNKIEEDKEISAESNRAIILNLSNNRVSGFVHFGKVSKFKRARKGGRAYSREGEETNTDGDPFEVAGEQLSRGPLRFDDHGIERSIDRSIG